MQKINLNAVGKTIVTMARMHAPEFLVAIGITGMFGGAVLAVKATPKSLDDIDTMRREKERNDELITKLDYVKATWKNYIPAAITGAASAGCIIAGTTVSIRRKTALAMAYKLSEEAFKEYKEATVDVIGKNKEKEIRARVAEKKIETRPMDKHEIYYTSHGNTLCLDPLSGRYFMSDINEIKKAVNLFNAALIGDNTKLLNDFYEYIGMESNDVGDMLGWRYYGEGTKGLLDMDFESALAPDGTPCLVMMYDVPPRYFDPREYSW